MDIPLLRDRWRRRGRRTFISGPDTFNDVQDISEQSFPAQDPSTGELAERLERELARVNELKQVGGRHLGVVVLSFAARVGAQSQYERLSRTCAAASKAFWLTAL